MIDPWDDSPESQAAMALARDTQQKMAEHARAQGDVKQQVIERMLMGARPEAIAVELGVALDDVWAWQGEAFYAAMGYPPELAEATGRSQVTRPRSSATKEAFDGLVARVFVPPLKQAGYRTNRLVWQRRTGDAWPTIAIERFKSDGDLSEFWCSWSVRVPGYGARMFPEFRPIRGSTGSSPGT